MPLNVHDSEDPQEPATGVPPEPPAAIASANGGSRRGMTLWIILLAVVASAIFLAIQFGIIPTGGAPVVGVSANTEPGATRPASPGPASSGDAVTLTRKPDPGAKESPASRVIRSEPGGKYTIFISAFSRETDAEELAGRWTEAGYNAFIQHSGGWYRVALGRYPTIVSAREEAEKLRKAFEEGYWIGQVEI